MTQARRLTGLISASFGRHFLVFLTACLGVLALAAATGWRWLYWVPLAWGIGLLIHYLVYKANSVDERWVEERTEELRLKSYDHDHIESIRSRHGRGDAPGDGINRRP